jgi:hypothetical protein
MWPSIAEDEIAKVLVVGQHNALIAIGNRQNIAVVQRLGMGASTQSVRPSLPV